MSPQRSAPYLRVLGGIAVAGLMLGATSAPAQAAKSKTPPKPKSVSAKATATTVTLKWTSGKGATKSFNVYKSTSSKVSLKTRVNSKRITGTSYKVSKLSPNKSYWFVVQSVGSKTSKHAQAAALKVTTLPVAPGGPTVTLVGSSQSVKLTWKASTKGNAATSWSLYRTTSATANPIAPAYLVTAKIAAATRSYTDNGRINGTKYRYAVVAVNKGGKGNSYVVSVTPQIAKPNAPIATATRGDSSVAVGWTPAATGTAVAKWYVYRSTTPTVAITPANLISSAAGIPAATLALNDTGRTNGTTYRYVVVGTNAGGSASSATVSAMPESAVPSKPTFAATAGDGHVSLTWGPTGDYPVTSWTVYRSTTTPVNTATATKVVNAAPGGTLAFDDTSVVNGTTYRYLVVAANAFGTTKSDEKSALPLVDPPTKPSLTADAGDHAVDLSWAPGAGSGAVAQWKVFRSTTAVVPTVGTPLTTTTSLLNYKDSSAANGVTYYYVVQAINVNSNAASDAASATPVAGTPSDLVATNPVAVAGSDAFVMSRLGYNVITNSVVNLIDPDNSDTPTWFGVTDRATVRVTNTSASTATITGVTISNSEFTLDGSAPSSLASGATVDLPVKFVYQGGAVFGPVVRTAVLTISADGMSDRVVPLVGQWQPGANCESSLASCGSQNVTNFEPALYQIVNDSFGWDTNIGFGLMNNRGNVASGDETLSRFWKRADTGAPVDVQRIAGFSSSGLGRINWYDTDDQYAQTRCANTTQSQGQADCHMVVAAGTPGPGTQGNPVRSQTLLPEGSTVHQFTPDSTTFALQIAGESSDNERNATTNDVGCTSPCGHHMRFFPVKTAAGAVVPNTYIVAVDINSVNDDFNDDVVLVTNIKPSTAS